MVEEAGEGRGARWGILFVLFENMSQRAGKKEGEEKEIMTRMDGGSKERGNRREPGPGACVEYEFAQLQFILPALQKNQEIK